MAKRTRPTSDPQTGTNPEERAEAPVSDLPETPSPTPPEAEPPQDPVPESSPREDDPPAEPTSDPVSPVEVPVPQDAPETRSEMPQAAPRSGFLGTLLGGVLAAAAGYGVATYFPLQPATPPVPQIAPEVEARLTVIDDRLSALEPLAEEGTALAARIAALESVEPPTPEPVDLSAVEANLAALESRLGSIESLPMEGNTAGSAALLSRVDALTAELESLRAEGTMARETIEAIAADAEARRTAAEAEAEALRQEAEAAAQKALRDAALGQVRAAMETGAAFAAPLLELGLAEVPEALASVAETGVPTLSALTEDFPPAARAALTAARHATSGGDLSQRLTSFLETATGARSLTPREGSDPDAVLSRAEAAVRAGDLSAALAEIAALPAEGQAELADWSVRATTRINALAAFAALPE